MKTNTKSKTYNIASSPLTMVAEKYIEMQTYKIKSDVQLHQLSKKGITKQFAEMIALKLGLTIYEFAPLLHISSRTLQRYQPDDLLDTTASEHVLLLEKLIEEGIEVFGNLENFKTWVHDKIRALDFERPIELLDTIFGIQMVNQILGRIKYGVYS